MAKFCATKIWGNMFLRNGSLCKSVTNIMYEMTSWKKWFLGFFGELSLYLYFWWNFSLMQLESWHLFSTSPILKSKPFKTPSKAKAFIFYSWAKVQAFFWILTKLWYVILQVFINILWQITNMLQFELPQTVKWTAY